MSKQKIDKQEQTKPELYTVLPVVSAPNIQLYNMDNLEFMRKCKDNEFDLAIVDPPYGLGNKKLTQGGTWAKKWKNTAKWDNATPTKEYFNELFRISKNQIIWGGNYFIDHLKSTRCIIIWDKIAHMQTMADFEMAWTSFDANSKIYKGIRNIQEKRIHVTQKPKKLYEWLLKNYAKQGDKILDTHLGSGSIALACHNYKFDLVGLEIDKEYFDNAVKRFENYKAQLTLF